MRFTKDHEYVRLDGNVATVGITDHAQHQLGDVVFVELPPLGMKFDKGAPAAVVESVKAASDVFCPVSGEVVAVNDVLTSQSSLINDEAQGGGWLFKVALSNPAEVEALMDEAAYADYLKTLG